jgi:lipid-binding SYLF domain-containing protein
VQSFAVFVFSIGHDRFGGGAHQQATDTVDLATTVLKSDTDAADENIPAAVLQNAVGVMIVPDVIKAGLIAGGRHGTGVLLARNENEGSLPVFVSITGGSLGVQAGVESSDLILVFNAQESLQRIMEGEKKGSQSQANLPVPPSAEKLQRALQTYANR